MGRGQLRSARRRRANGRGELTSSSTLCLCLPIQAGSYVAFSSDTSSRRIAFAELGDSDTIERSGRSRVSGLGPMLGTGGGGGARRGGVGKQGRR